MTKYFPVYAAILGVLALLLFLSPQIAKFISADTPAEPIQILKNINFADETLNSNVWIKKTNNQLNSIKSVSSTIRIENVKNPGEDITYTLLSQKAPLSREKSYRLKIRYSWTAFTNSSTFSFGIQKNGAASPYALIFPLSSQSGEIIEEQFFNIDESFKDNYFYIFVSGEGSLNISEIGLYEESRNDEILNNNSVGNLLPFPFEQAFHETPTPSPTASTSPSSVTSATPTPIPLPSPSPSTSPTSSQAISKAVQDSGATFKYIFYPGWNVVGLDKNINADIFATNNLDAYQMLGGRWAKSSDSQTVFAANSGLIAYSSNKDKKSIDLPKSDSQPSLTPTLGWNLLYNSSDAEVGDESKFKFSNGKTLAEEYKLKELVAGKRASSQVYLVSSDQSGVTLKKISFPEEAIPAKTIFWFYLYRL